jgi:hypothetical protein
MLYYGEAELRIFFEARYPAPNNRTNTILDCIFYVCTVYDQMAANAVNTEFCCHG